MSRILSKYTKKGNLKFISHLDILRTVQRAIKRADIKASYSEGFNPHMKTTFGYPLSLGIESIGEYFELEMKEELPLEEFVNRLNTALPKELQILKSSYTLDKESLMSKSSYASYIINIESEKVDYEKLEKLVEDMVKVGITYQRQKKDSKNKITTKELNTKDLVKDLKIDKINEDEFKLYTILMTKENGSMKLSELIELLNNNGIKVNYHSILKIDSLDKNLKPLLA